ncbi:hypothetical protein CNR22_22020 [Sphingobacteriaceae bacterium]|nr:hypothetical protein CNR22_22020 [Sphingobacteriaceae bacterium]
MAAKHVSNADERVNDYINGLPDFSKKICQRLREIVLKSDPKIIEDWKWGPNYYLNGMVCGYAAFQKHVNFVFFKGSLLKDKRKLLENTGSINTRHFHIKSAKDIHEDIILEYVFEAIDNNKAGKKVIAPDLALSGNIKREFKAAGVLKQFEALSPSQKKFHTQWIELAKKEETRIRRISQAVLKLRAMSADKLKRKAK